MRPPAHAVPRQEKPCEVSDSVVARTSCAEELRVLIVIDVRV